MNKTAPTTKPSAQSQRNFPVKVLEEIRERDRRDRTRVDSPLRPAPDATVVDSTDLSLEEVIERAAALVEEYLDRASITKLARS